MGFIVGGGVEGLTEFVLCMNLSFFEMVRGMEKRGGLERLTRQ